MLKEGVAGKGVWPGESLRGPHSGPRSEVSHLHSIPTHTCTLHDRDLTCLFGVREEDWSNGQLTNVANVAKLEYVCLECVCLEIFCCASF